MFWLVDSFQAKVEGHHQKVVVTSNVCFWKTSCSGIDALEDHEGTVSIGGRTITNLRFAGDIDGLAGEEELAKLVERLDKASTAYGMEISAEKTKLMTAPEASTLRSK